MKIQVVTSVVYGGKVFNPYEVLEIKDSEFKTFEKLGAFEVTVEKPEAKKEEEDKHEAKTKAKAEPKKGK